jgi:hypothetical protein
MAKLKLQQTLSKGNAELLRESEEATEDFINEGSRNVLVTSDEV